MVVSNTHCMVRHLVCKRKSTQKFLDEHGDNNMCTCIKILYVLNRLHAFAVFLIQVEM
jgi:hypothetical protein